MPPAREFDFLRLSRAGFACTQIAAQLGVKSTTVGNHTDRIVGMLGARHRAVALMRFLIRDRRGVP